MMDSAFEMQLNFRIFMSSYINLGYKSCFEDWNVRVFKDDIKLDNFQNENTVTFFIEDGVLFVEVRPWNSQEVTKSQNLDLVNPSSGWRDHHLNPCSNPAPEGLAFFEHLMKLSESSSLQPYCIDDLNPEYSGMRVEDFHSFIY